MLSDHGRVWPISICPGPSRIVTGCDSGVQAPTCRIRAKRWSGDGLPAASHSALCDRRAGLIAKCVGSLTTGHRTSERDAVIARHRLSRRQLHGDDLDAGAALCHIGHRRGARGGCSARSARNGGNRTCVGELVRLSAHPRWWRSAKPSSTTTDKSPRDLQRRGSDGISRRRGRPVCRSYPCARDNRRRGDPAGEAGRASSPSPLSSAAGRDRRRAGGYVSFSGILTCRNSPEIRAIAADVPRTGCWSRPTRPIWRRIPNLRRSARPSYVVHTARVWPTRSVSTRPRHLLDHENFFRLQQDLIRLTMS